MSMKTERPLAREGAVPALCLAAWVSWKSIFAGVLAALAVAMVLGLVGIALGFTVIDPMAAHPMEGVGATFGVWSLVSWVISLFVGGGVAGMFASQRGYMHGFLVWAGVLVICAVLTMSAVGAAVRGAGNLAASGVSAAGSAISGVAGEAADRGLDWLRDNRGRMQDDARLVSILRDTGVEQLQPKFWMDQLADARREMQTTMQRVNMDNYDSRIGSFLQKQQQRLETVKNTRIDREEAATGLMRSRGVSRDQAEMLLDQALPVYNQRLDQLTMVIEQGQRTLEDAREYLNEAAAEARRQADEAAAAAAKFALLAALTLILGAAAGIAGGMVGARRAVTCQVV